MAGRDLVGKGAAWLRRQIFIDREGISCKTSYFRLQTLPVPLKASIDQALSRLGPQALHREKFVMEIPA